MILYKCAGSLQVFSDGAAILAIQMIRGGYETMNSIPEIGQNSSEASSPENGSPSGSDNATDRHGPCRSIHTSWRARRIRQRDDARRAIDAATARRRSGARCPAPRRGRLLFDGSTGMDAHKDELAKPATREEGNPPESDGEVKRSNGHTGCSPRHGAQACRGVSRRKRTACFVIRARSRSAWSA